MHHHRVKKFNASTEKQFQDLLTWSMFGETVAHHILRSDVDVETRSTHKSTFPQGQNYKSLRFVLRYTLLPCDQLQDIIAATENINGQIIVASFLNSSSIFQIQLCRRR